jgi:hypothetical protein
MDTLPAATLSFNDRILSLAATSGAMILLARFDVVSMQANSASATRTPETSTPAKKNTHHIIQLAACPIHSL